MMLEDTLGKPGTGLIKESGPRRKKTTTRVHDSGMLPSLPDMCAASSSSSYASFSSFSSSSTATPPTSVDEPFVMPHSDPGLRYVRRDPSRPRRKKTSTPSFPTEEGGGAPVEEGVRALS